jgi:23S rRNA (cytidine2498-2'-O)-methyltransferase
LYQWIISCDVDFIDLASDEVRRLAPKARLSPLADGVFLVDSATPFQAAAAYWRQSPPIFVRHLCPVDLVFEMKDGSEVLARLAQAVQTQIAARLDPRLSFSVQTRILGDVGCKPFDVNTALADVLRADRRLTLDVRAPQQVLSVVVAPEDKGVSLAYVGLSQVEENLSSWAGGLRRFARVEGQISRAEFKLLEALEVFSIALPPNGVALDLGASPGGWTHVLRQHGQYVTAVDPGELDPRLASDRNIRHKRMTAEEYLRNDPDQFDVIVNDMRMDGRDSARLMVSYTPQLYTHGLALMTLKLPQQQRQPVLDHSFKLLKQAYIIAGARQLFHNRSEITVYLRPKY